MVGSNCVAIACDLRLGNQALTVACNFEKVSCGSGPPRGAGAGLGEVCGVG